MKRRSFIKSGATFAAGLTVLSSIPVSAEKLIGDNYTLPKLPFLQADLEPYIDDATMFLHHTKHHASYVARLNAESAAWTRFPSVEEIVKNISTYNTAVRNNAGGHYNHSFFWKILCPPGQKGPQNELLAQLEKSYGSVDNFKAEFKKSAMAVFGSGWTWLIVNKDGKLQIVNTANQDSPAMDVATVQGVPVIALDIWEHAYYLKHQNKRADYIDGWWNVVNWQQATQNYLTALK